MTVTIQELRSEIVKIVEDHHGVTGRDLDLMMLGRFLNVPNDQILLAISECVQSNQIKRIEYQVRENRSMFFTFYIPAGSRLA